MKRIMAVFTVLTLLAAFAPAPATAGYVSRRWEGVGMAAGVIGLMSLIFYSANQPQGNVASQPATVAPQAQPAYYPPPAPTRYCPPETYYVPGHWEYMRVWVPGYEESVWMEGFYDHCGRWRPGYYERHHREGYYEEKRVWRDGR